MESPTDWVDLVLESDLMDFWTLASHGLLDENYVERYKQSGGNLNDINHQGFTALMYACAFGHVRTVQLLLLFGVDCNIRDERGRNALVASVLNGRTSLVKSLAKFSDLNVVDGSNMTALHYAVELGMEEIVSYLVHSGASLDQPPHSTPLMLAARLGKLDYVKYLVESGADYRLKDRTGANAEAIAQHHGHVHIARFLSLLNASSIHEVLNGLGLAKYCNLFEQSSITFEEFLNWTEEDLKHLGLSLIGPRRKLSLALLELRKMAFKKIE